MVDTSVLPEEDVPESTEEQNATSKKHDIRFWAIFPGLCLTAILTSLESTILATALPTIVSDLHASTLSVWAINAYTLTYTAVQPLFGQTADLFGRKSSIVTSLALFLIGSGVCGTANNVATLVAGRAIQGLGGGGISILPPMVVSDLVPLRERPKYSAVILGATAMGTFLGPIVGGTMIDHIGWRWVFWFNLPIAGVAIGLVGVFMKVNHGRTASIWKQLSQIDYVGNIWLMTSVASVLWALSTGSGDHAWTSWRTLLTLLLGIFGIPVFILFESSKYCPVPTVPIRLFKHPTSALGFLASFLNGVNIYWAIYFLPVYFQAVLQATPQQSGINILPILIPIIPSGICGGFLISKTGRYKPSQIMGFSLASIALGCFATLDRGSPVALWIVVQIIFAAGAGLCITSALPTIQAPLLESDVGAATAVWGFAQGMGFICGMAIPTSIFESKFRTLLPTLEDVLVRETLRTGGAYEHASHKFIGSLGGAVQEQVVTAFEISLKLVWEVGVAFSILGVVAGLVVKEVSMRETLETRYGLENIDKVSDPEVPQTKAADSSESVDPINEKDSR
ncbi:hypothetical protein HYALB_00008962 [Hymenoscyphus albidus]|uniref:Major facilitator superfamily (MFS) profile domain-containing protein n=1 Tax=Hymenoscyphus albidus TaxID=595503 RepID=A0A9N9Q4B3_9HELO|nr:hypothetical protein HYALB_00008962 [Hymenoscyphus albidus]